MYDKFLQKRCKAEEKNPPEPLTTSISSFPYRKSNRSPSYPDINWGICYSNVPFIFNEKIEKRIMREEDSEVSRKNVP